MSRLYDPTLLVSLRPRPATIEVAQNQTVFEADASGFIPEGSGYGMYVRQGRILSLQRYTINGECPQPVVESNVRQHSWMGYYVAVPPGSEKGEKDLGSGMMEEVSELTLEFRLSRFVGDGMHEDVDITNFSQQETEFTLTLEVDADLADRQENHIGPRQNGQLTREWRAEEQEVVFDYYATHEYDVQGNRGRAELHRGSVVKIVQSDSPPSHEGRTITFELRLGPREHWHACIEYLPVFDDERLAAGYSCAQFDGVHTEMDRRRAEYLDRSPRFATGSVRTLSREVLEVLETSKRDLAALRLYDRDLPPRGWTMSAGLPIYIALFGRDTLTAAWQAALTGPEMMEGTVRELARWQGKEDNPWRDEQPGKMLHEAHTGPLADLLFHPRGRYYGAITTSAFYPVIVSELWHWTGDEGLVRAVLPAALDCFRWLDRYAHLNDDQFYDYRSRSVQGNRHQGWKDSDSAIVDHEGRQIEPPIATCEEQGFVYAAKLQFSEVLWSLGMNDEARRFFREAGELKKRFNDSFWDDELGTFAMALDPQGKPVRAVGSNPGHCIASGIADTELVERVADRLFTPDMFSGWGIRTLSSDNPAYNPYSYHRGSVWPVEHGSFALGFMRYGLWSHLHRMSQAMFEAAALYDYYRLPECFSGHARDEARPFPALYPKTNWPQAWSASASFCLVQGMLGLYPYAPWHLLIVDPHLPEWLPHFVIQDLRVGEATVSLEFTRQRNGSTGYRILSQRGKLRVLRQPSPWSISAGLGERIWDVWRSFAPAA